MIRTIRKEIPLLVQHCCKTAAGAFSDPTPAVSLCLYKQRVTFKVTHKYIAYLKKTTRMHNKHLEPLLMLQNIVSNTVILQGLYVIIKCLYNEEFDCRGRSMMRNIMFPNVPYTVGQFINANSIMAKMIVYVCVCTLLSIFKCVCPHVCMLVLCISVSLCVCVRVYERRNTTANSPNLFICKLDFG